MRRYNEKIPQEWKHFLKKYFTEEKAPYKKYFTCATLGCIFAWFNREVCDVTLPFRYHFILSNNDELYKQDIKNIEDMTNKINPNNLQSESNNSIYKVQVENLCRNDNLRRYVVNRHAIDPQLFLKYLWLQYFTANTNLWGHHGLKAKEMLLQLKGCIKQYVLCQNSLREDDIKDDTVLMRELKWDEMKVLLLRTLYSLSRTHFYTKEQSKEQQDEALGYCNLVESLAQETWIKDNDKSQYKEGWNYNRAYNKIVPSEDPYNIIDCHKQHAKCCIDLAKQHFNDKKQIKQYLDKALKAVLYPLKLSERIHSKKDVEALNVLSFILLMADNSGVKLQKNVNEIPKWVSEQGLANAEQATQIKNAMTLLEKAEIILNIVKITAAQGNYARADACHIMMQVLQQRLVLTKSQDLKQQIDCNKKERDSINVIRKQDDSFTLPQSDVPQNNDIKLNACYGVMYDNPLLNDKNMISLCKLAQAEKGNKGVSDLINVGTDIFKYSTFKLLRHELGDERAVKVILNYDRHQEYQEKPYRSSNIPVLHHIHAKVSISNDLVGITSITQPIVGISQDVVKQQK